MRLTVHIPNDTEKDLKNYAADQRKSLSSVVAESIEFYIKETKKRTAMQNITGMIGKVRVAKNTLRDLDDIRSDHDRS